MMMMNNPHHMLLTITQHAKTHHIYTHNINMAFLIVVQQTALFQPKQLSRIYILQQTGSVSPYQMDRKQSLPTNAPLIGQPSLSKHQQAISYLHYKTNPFSLL